ncbi:MAG: toll/interleukin-1 receptor domain-containing protein [Pseudomonadota bacterium]
MAHDVFLSYRRTDQALAQKLVQSLQAQGVSVWWDQMIEGGEDWREAIVENLTSARALVILFSEECNTSKQLKKELSIADSLDKEVIPVLIEDTKPKGHYLYELSARNWLQVHPNPEAKMAELAGRLAQELPTPNAGTSPWATAAEDTKIGGQPRGGVTIQPTPTPPIDLKSVPEPSIPAETVEKLVAASEKLESNEKDRNDFMPFKWYEYLIAAAMGGLTVLGGFDYETGEIVTGSLSLDFLGMTALVLLIIAMLVFPFRYYFRKRRVGRAVKYYAISVGILIVAVGAILGIHPDAIDDSLGAGENLLNMVLGSIIIFGFFSVITFGTYGLMHWQRTRRIFNRHVETL